MAWSSSSPTSSLTLVRHGQASYLEGDSYDRLSATGERQARCLGAYWAKHSIRFDGFFSGPAERHRRTAEIVAETMRRAGSAWADAVVIPEFDEFPGEDVVRQLTPILIEKHAHIRDLADAFEKARTKQERKTTLDLLFHEVAHRWVSGEVASPEVESWTEFTARVHRGVETVRRRMGAPGRAVVFTSGGPTAVTASLALEILPAHTLELCFSPRNTSYSEFRLQEGRVYLSSFNTHPHLEDPALLTYR